MDPTMHRIAQGLSDVSTTLRNSFSSLVLNSGTGAAGNGGGSAATAPDPGSSSSSSGGGGADVDLEKGRPELDHESRTGSVNGEGRRRRCRRKEDGTMVEETDVDSDDDARSTTQPPPPPPPTQQRPLTLQGLPLEVQMLIIRQMDFGDIERLRRVSRFYRDFVTPPMVRALFGPGLLRELILTHCAECLWQNEDRSGLLLASTTHRNYPFNAFCIKCAVVSRDERLLVGRKLMLGNGEGVWVCRWCGWPVQADAAVGHAQFHQSCYRRYNDSLMVYFLLGMLQFAIGVIAAALAWKYFRNVTLVFAPTVVSFIMLWFCFFTLMFRGNRVRTYHWSFAFELIVLGMWIPPIYYICMKYEENGMDSMPSSELAAQVMFVLNAIFRLLNTLGNLVLMCEYKRTDHHLPPEMIPIWRRVTNFLADGVIFWTYPQCVEQKYPPHWS